MRSLYRFSRSNLTFELDSLTTFAVDAERRTITGLIIPWGQTARSQGRMWRFRRGGLLPIENLRRIKLLRDHDNAQTLGYALSIEDTDVGLVGKFSVAPGPDGDRALALAAHGTLDGLSVGAEWDEADFAPDPLNPGTQLVHTYTMKETSLTGMPAFTDSRLTSVRASDQGESMNECPTCGAELKDGVAHTCSTPAVTPAAVPQAATFNQPSAPAAPAPTPPAVPAAPVVTSAPAPSSPVTFSAEQFTEFLRNLGGTPINAPAPAPVTPAAPPAARPVVDPTRPAPGGATFVKEPLPYRFTYKSNSGMMPGGKHQFHNGAEYDFSTDLFAYIDSNGAQAEAGKRVNSLINAAFADVDSTDLAGTIPARQAPELWQPQMDYATPLWDMIGSGTTDGRPFILPKFNSSSGMVNAAVEGVEPDVGAFTVTTQTITPTQVWGKVEITRQAIRQGGNPQISGIIWDQMLREYYEDREAAVATFLATLTAATDIAIPQTAGAPDNEDDQAGTAALEAAIADLMFVRGGNRFSAFAANQGLYRMLARVKDDAGRPLYPMINPMNSNGTTQRLFKIIDFAGTTVVPAWALGAPTTDTQNSWLFDPAKVRGWANAPERLDWNFGATVQSSTRIPQLSEVTMGIYGDLALANLDIAGVRQVTYDATGS
jgi:HK97 family phage prohead protease